jgi:hypothetical protein
MRGHAHVGSVKFRYLLVHFEHAPTAPQWLEMVCRVPHPPHHGLVLTSDTKRPPHMLVKRSLPCVCPSELVLTPPPLVHPRTNLRVAQHKVTQDLPVRQLPLALHALALSHEWCMTLRTKWKIHLLVASL